MKPVIFGLSGATLTPDERAFFADSQPAGYILFRRNIIDRAQLRALTDDLRALHGRDDLLIMIDQEGGRVARMQPPVWPAFPAGAVFDRLYDVAPSSAIAAARANARAIALTLAEVGITVDALPLLDVRQDGASDIMGDRTLGAEPMRVAALGRATLEGLADGGVVGIVKHMPGHGRALVDSHLELPVVRADADMLASDLQPFERLRDAPMGMTAHVVYTAWDAQRPASLSPTVIEDVIRTRIGFDGLLMSDDLDMKALQGSIPDLAAGVVAAGCDLALNCWGRMDDMLGIADQLPEISDAARARLDRAMGSVERGGDQPELAALLATRDSLLGLVAA
ncbi:MULTISPECIES: beta-N-acetylhexosaminidase [unclassified Sphingobium]|uniref:beta-N-acetylhexosaminidase n=1 Tax=unclassified Sphingobium TaxID=2611147 RepID=UPI000D16B5D3|nr:MULTISPECIES: beta-N-acetylhexosaminidase [unclassified Sphingobium]MBG6119519.1 beta-N-acetylhexosaminidase [Sphingobium sp. JAI105]PSO13381.1 beta-N-acetylhexosaminidase [Sphingobium sp. AEW4]TWD11628.1 beta-N-acetylhexosaminidase [Sphingobium sp. AEW010]TWD28481.1 beta-N-acetylhexosaminidase [Sphingobium sp. AEW013]TWD30170.1 beta-N-acetylhexosaminidase [Sphingobium sp. AEW001]